MTSLRKIYYRISGEGLRIPTPKRKPADAKLLDGMDDPIDLPPWMSNEDLDYYVSQFTKSGFRGPLNRYRNQYRDFEFLSPYGDQKILQASAFISGALEPVLKFVPGIDLIPSMRKRLEDLRIIEILEGASYWVQQERPNKVNKVLLQFLSELS